MIVRTSTILATFGLSVLASSANAAISIDFQQSGSDVVATTSGSLDIAGLTPAGNPTPNVGINPGFGAFTSVSGAVTLFTGMVGPSSFGSLNTFIAASSSSGDPFNMAGILGWVAVPENYVSGTSLSATTTFAGQSLATLGLTPGSSYAYSFNNDSVTITVGSAPAVPEPATWTMMILGIGTVGASLRRRSAKACFV